MAQTLDTIRELVRLHKGSRIFYRAANGRRKVEERNGIIQETYPSLLLSTLNLSRAQSPSVMRIF